MADANGDTPPSGAPAGETPPPSGDNTPPAVPPTGESTPPAGDNTPPATPPAGDETPPAPKDWATRRTEYAKGDEKLLKRLARYSSEESVVDALIAAQNKIAEGGAKSALPKDATPEQIKEWRTDNGIPETPEGYDVSTLPDGLIVGEAEKGIVDGYLKTAHDRNLSPDVVKDTVAYFMKAKEDAATARHQADEEARINGTIELKQEMGSEFETNKNLINNMLKAAPEGVLDTIHQSRGPDGTPIMSSPKVLRWLANVARELNPVATVVPGSGSNANATVESELSSITKLMADSKSEYWKGPNAQKMQARYRELVDFQQRTKK